MLFQKIMARPNVSYKSAIQNSISFYFPRRFCQSINLSAPCSFRNLLMNLLLQLTHSPLKNLAKKQKREKNTIYKMDYRSSKNAFKHFLRPRLFVHFLYCIFLFSSVLIKTFSGCRPCRQTRIFLWDFIFISYLLV